MQENPFYQWVDGPYLLRTSPNKLPKIKRGLRVLKVGQKFSMVQETFGTTRRKVCPSRTSGLSGTIYEVLRLRGGPKWRYRDHWTTCVPATCH